MFVLTHKLKASTLVETITAMVIVLVCLGIAIMSIDSIFKANNTRLKIFAFLKTCEISSQTKKNGIYFDEEIDINSLHISKKVYPYAKNNELTIIEIKAMNKDKKVLILHKEIIFIKDSL